MSTAEKKQPGSEVSSGNAPLIVKLGSATDLTGSQSRGDTKDGADYGREKYKYESEGRPE